MEMQLTHAEALEAALAQIDDYFASPETPERRKIRAKSRLERLVPALDGARKAVEAEKARDPGECPEIAIDPFSAYVVSWFLRREADMDESLAALVDEALEDAAETIAGGEVFGSAAEMLADLEAEIAFASYVAEHGEDPPRPGTAIRRRRSPTARQRALLAIADRNPEGGDAVAAPCVA